MTNKSILQRRKVYELSRWSTKNGVSEVLEVLPTICGHGLYILCTNNNVRRRTCVFCGKTEKVSASYQALPPEDIDVTALGETGEGVVERLREEVMAKFVQTSELMARDFTIALRLTRQYKEMHPYAGLFDYFKQILPPPKLYIVGHPSNKVMLYRIAKNLTDNGFWLYSYLEYAKECECIHFANMDMCGDCDGLIVVNPDTIINGRVRTGYISHIMNKCVEEANKKAKRVFYTNMLDNGNSKFKGKGKILTADYFMLHNVFVP